MVVNSRAAISRCRLISAKDGRFRGLTDQHCVWRSFKPPGIVVANGKPRSFSLPMPHMIDVESSPGYGWSPTRSSQRITPKAQTSIFSVQFSLRTTSGAIQATVPANDICMLFWFSSHGRIVPKSEIFTKSVLQTRTLRKNGRKKHNTIKKGLRYVTRKLFSPPFFHFWFFQLHVFFITFFGVSSLTFQNSIFDFEKSAKVLSSITDVFHVAWTIRWAGLF